MYMHKEAYICGRVICIKRPIYVDKVTYLRLSHMRNSQKSLMYMHKEACLYGKKNCLYEKEPYAIYMDKKVYVR